MKRRPLWPLLPPIAALGMMMAFLSIAQWTHKPNTSCGVKQFTGLHCPGCGGTRCAQNIVRGDLLAAFSNNAMLMAAASIFLLASAYLIVRITILGKPAPSIPKIRPSWLWTILALVALFTILRNIPSWPFSLLAP